MRKIFETEAGQCLTIEDYDNGGTFCINELQEFINNAISNGATDVRISTFCGDVDIQPLKRVRHVDD